MWKIFALLMLVSVSACNKDGQGFRDNQEQETAPNDYTQGTDARNEPQTRR